MRFYISDMQPHSQKNITGYLLYQAIFHVNVCIERLVIINNFTTLDQKTITLKQRDIKQYLIMGRQVYSARLKSCGRISL